MQFLLLQAQHQSWLSSIDALSHHANSKSQLTQVEVTIPASHLPELQQLFCRQQD